ncbi:MAG: twin-arginine translocation signal domain-containing protein, partial [Planctomycetota bacterium]
GPSWPSGSKLDRREFVKTAGAAGLVGAVGSMAMRPLGAAGAPHPGAPIFPQATEFPQPEGLRPGAQCDSRFPVSFQESVQQGLRLATDYFAALNQRDIKGLADTLHFPFAINEDIEPLVFESASALIATPAPTLNFTSQGVSRVGVGTYDLLEGVNVHLYCPVGAVVSVAFQRYNARGYKLGDYDCLFSVTNNDHRWGIQMVSSIFHELGYAGIKYPFVEETDIRERQGYLAAFGYRDEKTLDDLTIGRGSYEDRLPVGTRTASVNWGFSPREATKGARAGTPMARWKVSGVKSRLTVSTVEPLPAKPTFSTNLKEFVDLAGQTVGPYSYTRQPPRPPLILHATHDKAHTIGGYWRYTAEGELITETKYVGLRIYKGGVWGSGGMMGFIVHHDRSNSMG